MAEFNIRTDSVDVEQIMRQIRARIKEKRGVDYTEQQIEELANVKLQRFLDPKGVRSDLVEQFKRTRGTSPEPPNYSFEDTTLYETHRGIVRLLRKLFNPLLKLLFNPNPIVHVLHMQGEINNINAQQFRVREELDALYYEVIHNLVLEVTRLGIESKNLKMKVESLSSRMDFDERRARALETVVQYKSGSGPSKEPQQAPRRSQERPQERAPEPPRYPAPPTPAPAPTTAAPAVAAAVQDSTGVSLPAGAAPGTAADGTAAGGTARRRRRRRRGRRGGKGRTNEGVMADGTPSSEGDAANPAASGAAHEPQGDFYDSEEDGTDSGVDIDGGDDRGPESSEQ